MKLDLEHYPTLRTYSEHMVENAVKKLMEKYPDMTVEQCLMNLDFDLEEVNLKATSGE